MKILYLKPEHGRPFFYADPAEIQADASPATGPLGWAGRKWEDLEALWKGSEGSAARWSRKAWDRLHSWVHPDEPLLTRLGTADSVEIRHPASIPAKKARAAWKRYLARRARSHLFWLIVDGVLTPITGLVLWILPGPNVVFFWFAYRAYGHYAIVRALHRARWSPPLTTFEPDPALDAPVRPDAHGAPTHDAVESAENLRTYIERRRPSDDQHHDDHGSEIETDPDFDDHAGSKDVVANQP